MIFLYYRHHTYKKTDHKNIELTEVGPRFEMKCTYSHIKRLFSRLIQHEEIFSQSSL